MCFRVFLLAEIDDAVAEFSVPLHRLPPPHQDGLLSGRRSGDAVKLLSAQTSVRIHVPDLGNSNQRGRDHHSHSNAIVVTLEGAVAGVFQALAAFAAALSHQRPPPARFAVAQLESDCRFIGDAKGSENNSTGSSSKENWRRCDKEGEDLHPVTANYEQYVNVPASLMGLLMARREPLPCVIKQIEAGSRTLLLKLPVPLLPGSVSATDQEQAQSQGGDVKARGSRREQVAVETYAVRGASVADVQLGASCLLRIVTGDKIVMVLADLVARSSDRDKASEHKRSGSGSVGPASSNREARRGQDNREQDLSSSSRFSSDAPALPFSGPGRGGGGRGGGKGRAGRDSGRGGRGKPSATGRGGGRLLESGSSDGNQHSARSADKAGQ